MGTNKKSGQFVLCMFLFLFILYNALRHGSTTSIKKENVWIGNGLEMVGDWFSGLSSGSYSQHSSINS